MKAHSSQIPVMVWMLAGLSLTSGLAQNSDQPSPATSATVLVTTSNAKLSSVRPRLSPWAREVMKLAQAGIEDRVLLAFVDNSGTFNLGADQIIQLNEAGLSSDVVTAMLQHDADLVSGARVLTTTTSPPMDPDLEKLLLAVRNAPEDTNQIRVVKQAQTSRPEPTDDDWGQNLQEETVWTAAVGQPSAPLAPTDQTKSPQAATLVWSTDVAQKSVSSYRTPETRSVQLVPPIIVLNSASPPPNVIIIDMFPSSR